MKYSLHAVDGEGLDECSVVLLDFRFGEDWELSALFFGYDSFYLRNHIVIEYFISFMKFRRKEKPVRVCFPMLEAGDFVWREYRID